MKNYTRKALVYTTTINGTTTECLHKFIVRATEEEFNEILSREIKETGLDLRYNENIELL